MSIATKKKVMDAAGITILAVFALMMFLFALAMTVDPIGEAFTDWLIQIGIFDWVLDGDNTFHRSTPDNTT